MGLAVHKIRNTPPDRAGQVSGQAGPFLWGPPPVTKKKTELPPGFSRFWGAWPVSIRKTNRPGCAAIWRSRGLEKIVESVIAGLEKWKKSDDWTKESGRWICQPATWLRQERWQIEEKPDQPKLQSGAW